MNKKTFLTLSILVIIAVIVAVFVILNNPDKTTQGEGETPDPAEGTERGKELDIESEIREYDSSEEIMNFINQDFNIVEKENKTMDPVYELYERKNGSKYEALRLARFMLQKNGLEAVYFVYDYGGGIDAVINFRDVEKPKYYYFENNELKMKHHGWDFGDLILSEEERRGISIKRIGVLGLNRLVKRDKLNLMNVSDWDDRERWVN